MSVQGCGIDEPRLLLSDNTSVDSPLFSPTSSDKCRPLQCRDGLKNRSVIIVKEQLRSRESRIEVAVRLVQCNHEISRGENAGGFDVGR